MIAELILAGPTNQAATLNAAPSAGFSEFSADVVGTIRCLQGGLGFGQVRQRRFILEST